MPRRDEIGGAVELDARPQETQALLEDGVVVLDQAGAILSYNETAGILSGLSNAHIGLNYFRDAVPSTNVPGFHGRFLSCVRGSRPGDSFEFVYGRVPHPVRARITLQAAPEPGHWRLLISPLTRIDAGHSREAVISAIGRRARAEPVDPALCEREPIHIPGTIQPNAVMIAADADSLEIIAFSANVYDAVAAGFEPLDGRPLADVLPADFVAAARPLRP